MGAHLGAGIDEQLGRGIRGDHRADVAAIHHRARDCRRADVLRKLRWKSNSAARTDGKAETFDAALPISAERIAGSPACSRSMAVRRLERIGLIRRIAAGS